MSSFTSLCAKLRRSRRKYKKYLNSAIKALTEEDPSWEFFVRQENDIKEFLKEIKGINDEIVDLCEENEIAEDDKDFVEDQEIEFKFINTTNKTLAGIESKIKKPIPLKQENVQDAAAAPLIDAKALAQALAETQKASSAPKLYCPRFSGEKITDKFEFKNFLSQFKVVCATDGTPSAKLQRLRSQLDGEALQFIQHLSISDANYEIALKTLEDIYLDIDYIKDEIFRQLHDSCPKYDPDFKGVITYLHKIKADLNELKNPDTYNVDLLSDAIPANQYISHVVFNKLPPIIKRDLIFKSETSYPSLSQIFEHYNEIIKNLIRTRKSSQTPNIKSNSKPFAWKPKTKSVNESKSNPSTLENFNTYANTLHCKFCNAGGHSMFHCPQFTTLNSRIQRCKELKLCNLCSSNKHLANKCFGKQNKLNWECKLCKSKSHISALCNKMSESNNESTAEITPDSQNNVCYTTSGLEQQHILPIVNICINRNNKNYNFNCLLDTGSQRTYFSKHVLQTINCNDSFVTEK